MSFHRPLRRLRICAIRKILRFAMERLKLHMAGEAEQYRITVRMRHKQGHWVSILTTGQVIQRNDKGEATRAAGIHIDLTERVENEEAFKASEFGIGRIRISHIS